MSAHHYRGVCRHDVIIAVCSSDSDGVGAQPRLGVGFSIEFLDADRLEGRGPLDGSQPIGEGRGAIEVVGQVVVVPAGLMITVVAVAAGYTVLLILVAASLLLGSIPLAMPVVDAGL